MIKVPCWIVEVGITMAEFSGFPKGCLPFLVELKANNERGWFNNNKQRYESLVREPALAFIEIMAPKLTEISTHFQAIARKRGGSLMRVYRDTRFSKDKTPYKTRASKLAKFMK